MKRLITLVLALAITFPAWGVPSSTVPNSLLNRAANTVDGNATASTAAVTGLAVPSCSTAGSALQWTTNTGFACNTSITANIIANVAGGLASITTINDTVTPTTGGITLASQTAAATHVWRVRAFGTFVAVSSATARNAQLAAFWGSTALVTISEPVLVSVAQTTNWEAEFTLTSTSTTAVWTSGYFMSKVDTPAISAGVTEYEHSAHAAPASTTVTAGAQTIDLRFSMSAAVATDQWTIESVTIEQIK